FILFRPFAYYFCITSVRKHVNDLYEDLRDGHNLISLLEVLSGDTLPREKGRMRFHRLQNVQIALDYLKRRQVKLVNIRNDDITDGNPKLTLGLIWTIILHFQISDIHVTGESEDMTAKERLLLWSQQMTEGYVGVRCGNFTTSWRDGRLFNAIIHKYRPDLVDMSRVSTQSSRSNLEQAFGVAEQLGVARLLDPEDVDVSSPDEKSVITYVSTLYDVFPKVPEGMEGISANDVDIKWVEYQNMVKYLSQWIKHNVTVMSDRNFPSNPVELKALYTQYLLFKENEIPPKENEKAKIKHLYKMLEVWIEFGRIQLPQGYHPNDVEKEWGKLIVAMLEREKSLRPEVDRLEMLQQIANRVQRDCVAGEDKLVLARTALQSDAKRLESGIQFQNEAEIAGYLLECENLLRQQVLDIQLLLDGKFYLADQLVQRVSKLRDDLLALRTECSTVYSKARTLTSEQTKMMISGITQSLNSNFSPNFSAGLSPALTHGGLVTSGGSPAMSPAMTPSMQPASVQTYLSGRGGGGGGGMEPGVLQQLKHMQIRKPMLKSSFLDPSLTEDEVNVKFVQDLLNWVEEMQVQLDQAEWGSDLPSVESNLGNHKDFHKAIEEFQMSIKEAKMSEIQMTQPLKQSYSEKLNKLESQYGRLLRCSSERQKHLDSLYDFVSRATQELIWLNEKEEEEVAFDWSERNSNISRKRDYHADLMRELDDKEEVIKTVQEKAESLLLENHPARLTIEAYRAAMQTQWSWILQLCHCVEQHLKENAVYFDFFSDAKESLDYLRSLQDAIHRKYSCDRNSSLHRLEDLIQESMDEKEQLLKYSSTVGGLVGRAKSVVQLKARNPENPIRTSLPVKSICDYRQIEITISKEDECVLVSNSHRAKWKVISPSGNEAMVPSVCFSVPPPNKEATEMASRIEQLYQNALALWHHSHINMKSVVSWHYLMTDIRTIRKSTVASIKTLLPGDHEQVLSSLQSHFEDFLRDSDESEVFTVADCAQLEKEVLTCKEYYEELLKSAEREEHEESVYNLFISEVRNFRMRVEGHEEQLIRKIRTPLDRDDLQECVLRITEQEKVELDRLKDDLETLREKCEVFLRQAASSPSVPTLSSELNILTQSTNQVYSMCCIYLEKLKTVSLVVKHSQSAEALVKLYEAKLCEEDTINANIKSIDGVMSTLKQWRSEIDERREVFHDLEDELQKARVVSERMFKTHNERDFDLDWHKEKADQLKERWQNIHSQIENRLRDLEGISKSLKYYKDTYNSLDEWSKEMETKQLKAQENQPEDSKALAEFLNQQKVLVAEIEQKQSKIEECQKYSEQYAVGVKDYELQLMTYRAMVDSQHKSPVKRRKMQSSSDVIQQEFMDLRTRYTALVTLMTQYVKFAGETLKRAEEDERSVDDEKKEHGDKVNKLLNWMSSMKTNLNKDAKAQSDGKPSTESTSKPQVNKSNYLIVFFIVLFNRSSALDLTEKQEAKEQLKSLHQAYSELSQQCSDAASSADQLITTGLIWPEQHLYMDLEDAFKNRLVDDAMCKQLQELNEAKKCLQNLQFALEPLPVITALENGAISEQTAIKIIEIQLATGGLRPTYTGDILHLERAFQLGLIPESLFIQILERKDSWKNLIDPNTAEKVTLSQLMQSSIVHKLTGLCLLPVKRGKDGNISLMTGREISIMKAMHEGIIDRETMFRLLSTQLFAQNGGIVNPCNRSRLTVDEAVQCDLISSSSALLVLERQKAFMGLLWPNAGEILSFSTSLQQNMITGKLASELLRNRHKITALYIPETSEVVDIDSAVENNLVETFTKELLKTIEIPDVFPDIDELNNRFSSWLVMRELQIDGSCSAGEEISDENSTDAPSPSEAKQLFISYLMMNSYMDPKSGQRLLIFDWQLNKMAKLLFETSESEHVDETSGLHMKVSEESQMNNNISDNDNACLNADYSALGELQICKPLESTMEKDDLKSFLNEIIQMKMDGASVDETQKQKCQAIDSIIKIIQHHSGISPTNHPNSNERGGDPDILLDLKKHEERREAQNWPSDESNDEPKHQTDLLEMIQGISTDRDKGMLEEVDGKPSSPLGGTALREESMEAKIIPMHVLDEGVSIMVYFLQRYSTQNYLECVGRLQDHCDTLEDIRSDLQTKGPLAEDIEGLHCQLEEVQDIEKDLSGTRQLLEDAAFDIQNFISEHAQFLSPTDSRHLLRALSTTQRSFKELMDRVFTQRQALEIQLEICEDETQQQKQREFSEKLQELFDDLTQTENRLIGHQQQAASAKTVGDLQQYQQEHQALQKDLQANASALNEVISSTKKFLEENRSKLTPEQISALENKLEELKSKANMLNQKAEESRKDLEQVLTSAIKQETEKEAAVEQLEESKTKIEGLLGWISNIGKEKEMGGIQKDQMVKQNGNMPEYTSMKGIIGEEDDPNGNALDTTDNTSLHAGEKQDGKDLDLDQQFNRVQAHHQEILSQQQDLIIATQSAQALLDKQAQVLSPAEKDKLQRDIKELKGRYEASLTQAEQQMKQVQTVQEELQKFKGDCEEFETWLQQAKGEMKELGAPAAGLDTLSNNLQRQKSFSEDVMSHKGDLRFITISGQKVLDAAKACDHSESDGLPMVDMSGTCAAVKERLDSAASRYKALHTQCNQLGNNLKDVVDKYKKYEDASGALVKWLNASEEESRRQQSEPIAGDPQTLQRQLEETKSLQGQTTSRQAAVDTLRKTADALISAEGDLLSHPGEIQETVDDIVERYDNLSKSVSDRNEKLQVTLTRSLSVQDGLDEMMSWMEKVEESVKETPKVPLDSSSIADALSKEAALEQDMSSRQSSIMAMKAKVKKFVESAEPAAAALLQTKMEGLSQRFTDASEQHKQQVAQMEELQDKVEQFEKTSEKVQQFVLKSSQALSETDGPGKTVAELSQLLQVSEHSKDVETLQKLTEELCKLGPEGSAALLQSKKQNISDSFNAFKETITEKKEEVSSCQKQLQEFKSAAGVLMKWLEETKEQVPVLQPNCSEQGLGTDLQKVNGLLDEWTSKAPAVQDINSKGSALCSLISVLTSPAKAKMRHNSAVINGSDPGSHSYLTNQELMLVQQNMSYINNDYEHLGELLKARSSELSALLKRVQGVHDQAESLRQWMEDTKKTAASSGCQVVLGMYSHISDAGWEEVKGTMEIRKQHLEESSRMLELFQTTQPQLSLWLQEKELMMGVLGPLSVDPNMLNTQKQQVQILLKEFDSRKPQYEKLTEAATAIASASEQQDPAVEQVKEQLASVSQKWQALTGQLSQRHALIEQAVGKTTQFQELLQSLSKSATCLETELNNQQALSTQPDEVKKQIEATNAILAQLREEKKRLKEAESVCSELSAMVTEEYLRADLTKQLEGITKPFRQLEDKAGKRIEQLNSAFASSQQFHQTSKDFQAWLNQTLQEQCKPQPVSANAEKLKQSLKENSAVQKAISEHEEPYNTIIKEGEALLQSTEGAEKVALQGQLSALKSSWDDVKKSNAAQAEKLQGALQRALKYKEHSEKLSSWLQECEDREKNVKLSANSVEIEGSLSQLKAIQKDVDKHRGQVAMANTAADSLLEVVTSDGDSVREEKATIGKRVDKLTEDLTLKRESLENISQKLKEFNDLQKEAKGQLEAARKQLDSHSALGVQAYSNKNLTNMKAQHNSLEGVHNQIEHLKNLAKSLVVDASEVEGVTDLLLQADSLEKDHMSITKKVEDACSTLENKLQGIGQFQNSIREMFANFTDLDDEFDGMAPVGRGLDTLRDQQSTIKDFVARLQDLMTNTANGRDSCNKMLESEASPDLLGLKRDLETLGKQCGKLMDRATGRREQVEETLSHLEEFYVKAQEFTHKLSSAEKQEESQGSVGLETEVINQQLETFKIFQRDVIESLQSQLQELNTLGQALIQNAAKGTSTKKLDQDLEEVNTRWNTLNKKVAERSAQLHEALLHCGRFQDALESLLSWLTDTEELVANQKPPSAEFKVVKAQIQEQKLLQRLLDDRRATVELIKTEGRKVTDLADTVDKEKIARETECLGQRWEDLLKKAENRQKQLENILVVAQQFHETLVPLAEWLTATEKRLANSELIGTQTSKLEEQISQHKALEEEVLGRGKILYQAMSLGQSLRTVSCVDDKELVQAKLDNTHSSYIELQEHCRQKAELLRQALANAQLFGEDEVALMTWLDEVHSKLSEVSIQDYTTAVLAKQHAEQLALHEDIELRKQNIEQAILNGLELLKQTTGDEVVVIQGKLDGIKTRYSEINTMSNNVSKTLDKALSLATKLQNTHEELNAWLEKVESELAMFKAQEPVGEQLTCLQERQKTLMKEVKDQKPLVDSLNEVSSALLELVPWRAREGLDRMVTDDNERYRTASDAITQHVDQTGAAILKSQQFEQAATSELEWLTEAERKLSCLGDVRLEPEQTTAQLQAQKSFSMDIMRHKDAVDVIVKTGEAIINKKDEAEKQTLRVKLQALSEKYSVVSQLNSERCLQLERAHSLASQFWETYDELWPWLQETRTTFTQLSQPAIEYEALRQQQEELRQMREVIAEHKPHIDKMNKTGPQLLELSPTEGAPIREKYEAADKLYSQLKVDVKHRAAALDEAISKSTQFHDKIDPMLESLERIAERLRQPPSISVEVEKIREQISDNKAVNVDLEKLQPSYETLKQRGEEMIARSEGADKDLSAKAVQDKLDLMVFLWNDIQALLEEREAKLLDVMDLAEKFWCDHCALIVTIKDTHDLLKELEEPGVDPSVVKQQQESAEGFREEIDGLQEELNVVQNLGAELMTACGEPDKPVIKKSIDEVNSAWETLSKTWKERVETLEEAMQAAVQFQDSLQNMFDSVDIMEGKLDSMSPVGTDLETVKQQIEELKEFKGDAYQLQIEMERLNHQTGLLLKKVVEEADRTSILEPMNELKMLWDDLDKKIINRQHKLEGALLALGQFQHALDELVAWLTHTEELLSEQRKACGDPKAIEIELAKHHVLQNDVLAHKTTVEAVNKAGSDLIDSSAGEEARGLQNKLENLNKRWKTILEKTEQRRQLLDSALLQAQGFHGEIEDMQQWLKDSERQLLASKALGGLPDTAREQLNTHLELCSTLEAKEEIYKQLLDRGQQILAMTPEGQDSTTELDLRNLQEKWACVRAKVTERKVKLEEALAMATDFHNSLQDFINWLMQAEQTLAMASPASLILETIMFQIDEHKVFVTEVNSHRDQIIELDKTGTHLKYFSQKQDVVLIRNLLLSVQGRWEKVVQRSVERGRLLDDARKRAKQFHESWNKLMEWLEDKHSVYDTTSRTGRALKDKTSLLDDNQKLDDMLSELRDKWDTVCGKSVERQNKLEEALLFSGQFTDALQALIDWLYKVEPQLAEDQPVHGDIDLVLNLIDSHKVFQKELGKRTGSVQALKRSARELIEISHDDSSWVKVQMQELSTRWETVCSLSVSKQTRLEQALCQAEEFHSTVHILLEWLAEAEQSLRFHGALPDDEEALRALIEQHKEFMKKLEEKRQALNKATSLGEAILSICHPDSITTIKHWNTIIKARFEEVMAWARQHQQRLSSALAELLATQELLENLLNWLQWAETTLGEKDKDPLPQELEEVKTLIAEHQAFMEEMTRKQPDVDKITKTHKRKATADPPVQSQIPILEKGRTARKRSPTQSMYTAASQAQIETKNPRVNLLVSKWQQVWLLALDRRRKLNDALDRLEELKEFANFDFDVWRKRYMRWMNHKKSRVMDFFRRIDKDQDGKVTRQEFIDGILSSKFPTSRLEMSAVADIFDRDGDGYIDYYEFVAALHPNKDAYKPLTDADKIEDEVTRQVAKCKCPKRFQVEQIGANKYRFYLGNQFGDSQQLRLVRILRSTVMVRVGGGWMALDEFLVKNDPCRAKGRTNVELREKFILPEGTTQVMASFRYRGRRSRPSSRGTSPNRSNSSHSCPAQPNPPGSNTPKTPQHVTRNYDKPWLTNSKSATPLKSSDSFDSQGSSNESTPIQGSKLRLPGYLSGKGFQSGEDGSLINAAVMKARGQAMGLSKIPSRPGSKAGSRGSSRRGSDASDFDISDIQSVCSDVLETVTVTPRSASRQHGGKPSKIPTPQRRSTPTSKLAKTTKR
uniref:Dystonin n=1 Tax=Sinocyclocheilus rhinocerous TaxID=307959 RepID=A0A673MFR7_9TELE